MAFLFDKKYFGEAEDEFEDQVTQEQDRYSQLRDRFLSGQTLGYGELEELYAAAKAKGDAHVVGALKNVVDDPPTDGAGEEEPQESLYEEMLCQALAEAKEQAQDVDEAELSQEEMDDIADMFAGYSGLSNGDDRVERRERQRRMAADFMRRHSDELKKMLDQPSQASGLGDFSHAYDFEANESSDPNGEKFASAVEDILGEILGMFGIDESGDAEDAAENIKKILDKAGLKGEEAEKAIAAAAKKAEKKADPAEVKKAVKSVKSEIEKLDEEELDEEEFAEKDDVLPAYVVNEALETLRRMY